MSMCISDRCITISGRTFNLETGFEWSAIISEHQDQNLKCRWHRFLPNSSLSLTLVESKEESAFVLKDAPNSRKLTLFDRRQSDVRLFEMIDNSNYLAQIQCSDHHSYWTMLNKKGQILDID